jgi:hypothetical protein
LSDSLKDIKPHCKKQKAEGCNALSSPFRLRLPSFI